MVTLNFWLSLKIYTEIHIHTKENTNTYKYKKYIIIQIM